MRCLDMNYARFYLLLMADCDVRLPLRLFASDFVAAMGQFHCLILASGDMNLLSSSSQVSEKGITRQSKSTILRQHRWDMLRQGHADKKTNTFCWICINSNDPKLKEGFI